MNDPTVFALRVVLILLLCYAGTMTWALSYMRRHSLSFWEAMTRSSIGLFFFGSAFATLSSMLGWDADLRVTLLVVSAVGVCVGLTMTAIREEERPLPRPIQSVAKSTTPVQKEIS